MSNLAIHTETAVIKVLGRAMKVFDDLSGLNKTMSDAQEIAAAERHLENVLRKNGYISYYSPGKGTTIKKIPTK